MCDNNSIDIEDEHIGIAVEINEAYKEYDKQELHVDEFFEIISRGVLEQARYILDNPVIYNKIDKFAGEIIDKLDAKIRKYFGRELKSEY